MSGDHENVVALVDAAQRKRKASTGRVYADFADPVAAAHSIVERDHMEACMRTLHAWQAEFFVWQGTHYAVMPLADLRARLYEIGPACSDKPVKRATVDNVVDALRGVANLSHLTVPTVPAWVPFPAGALAPVADPDPRRLIPLRNGLLNIDDGELMPPSARYFTTYALPFDYEPESAPPAAWLAFLASVWPDDPESIACLQEFMGYLLTADTAMQKGLMIVGPKRGGKGTIGRVIEQLVGAGNTANPTLASLGQPFGLQCLIGKALALMSDVRLGKQADIAAIAENVLRIIGEDTVGVPRKFQPDFTARLLCRIVVLTNEVPLFRDAAAALPSRFLILRTTRSFYGQEDHELGTKLAAELPAIFVWALEGLRRLRERGRFVQPASAAQHIRLMEDMASPVGAFLREQCVVEPGAEVPVQKLYAAWVQWCHDHGREKHGNEQTFGRDIAAAAPAVDAYRPRINGERVRYYRGVRLRTPDDPEIEGDDE